MASWKCCLEFSKLFLSNYNDGLVSDNPFPRRSRGFHGDAIKEGERLSRCICRQSWVTWGLPFQAPQQWWLRNVLLNTLLGVVLNEGRATLFKATTSIFSGFMFMGLTLFLARVWKVSDNNKDHYSWHLLSPYYMPCAQLSILHSVLAFNLENTSEVGTSIHVF